MKSLLTIFLFGIMFSLSSCQEVTQADKGPILKEDPKKDGGISSFFGSLLVANDSQEDAGDEFLNGSAEGSLQQLDEAEYTPDPVEAEQVDENAIYAESESSLYADFSSDENGFGPWKIDNFRSNPADDYTKGALARCHNGTTIQTRECFAMDDPSKCLGVIEKEVSCSELDLHIPTYSAWTKAVAVGNCENGNQAYQRQCISFDGTTPHCYGPSQFSLPCGATVDLNKINQKFSVKTTCLPSSEANNHYRTLCGGGTLSYNGVASVYNNCYIDQYGQTQCPDEAAEQKWCFLPTTVCSDQIGDNMVPGTTYPNHGGGYCGVLVGSASDESAEFGFSEYDVPVLSLQSILGEVQNCGTSNKKIVKRGCVKNNKLPKCMYSIDQIQQGAHQDSSCTGDISKIVSCEHGSSYQQLNRDGQWGEWKTVTGCHHNSELNKTVRVQQRECIGTRREGSYCQGDKVRYVQCSGVYDGLKVKLIVDSELQEDSSVYSKIQQYQNLVNNKGAQVELMSVNTSAMGSEELRSLLSGIDPSFKVISLIGDFPYADVALVDDHTFSSQTTQVVSDFPFMLSSDVYNLNSSTGLYEFNQVYQDQPMDIERLIFRTNFSDHTLERAGVSSSSQKYAHYFDKVIAHHSLTSDVAYPENDLKTLELLDEHWDRQTSTFQTSVNIKTTSFHGINKTNRGGFKELFAQNAGYGLFMVHGNGEVLSFTDYAYMPNNGHEVDLSTNSVLVKNIKSEDIFNDIEVKVPVLGMFNCYSLAPGVESNVGHSFLLGKNSDVIASYGAYGSGSIHQWSMVDLTRTLLTGDSISQALLRWSATQKLGTTVTYHSMMNYQYNGMKWHIPMAFAGDPLARTIEQEQVMY